MHQRYFLLFSVSISSLRAHNVNKNKCRIFFTTKQRFSLSLSLSPPVSSSLARSSLLDHRGEIAELSVRPWVVHRASHILNLASSSPRLASPHLVSPRLVRIKTRSSIPEPTHDRSPLALSPFLQIPIYIPFAFNRASIMPG